VGVARPAGAGRHPRLLDRGPVAPPRAGGDIRRVPKAGGATEVFVSRPAEPQALALDATHVYWTEPDAGRILRAPKAGGGAGPPWSRAAPSSGRSPSTTPTCTGRSAGNGASSGS
jgi:hypothetical protein